MKYAVFSLLPLVVVSAKQIASAAPTGDTYLATGNELVDSYENAPLVLNGAPKIVNTVFDATRITERFQAFAGFPGGVQVVRASGANQSVSSWDGAGHVLEFTISNAYGFFLSFTPDQFFGIEITDIDLDHQGSAGTPQVVGLYLDARNSAGQSMPYNLDPSWLGPEPIGVGNHPFDTGRKVVYVTSTGPDFSSLGLTTLSGNKLRLFFDSDIHLQGVTSSLMVQGMGITSDPAEPPYIDQFTIGIFIKGMPAQTAPSGDFDGDGDVDGRDFLAWQRGYGQTGGAGPDDGDADGDGDVDGTDLTTWQSQYGGPPPLTAPPEAITAASPASNLPGTSGKGTPTSRLEWQTRLRAVRAALAKLAADKKSK